MAKKRKVTWDELAINSLDESLYWIEQRSIQQAEMIADSIIESIERARIYPKRFPPDKFKLKNSGSIRAFEVKNFRISYSDSRGLIRILRVRSVYQYPILH